MSKKGAPPAPERYRDDTDALSMHTTPDDYEYPEPAGPPSYGESESASVAPRGPQHLPHPEAPETYTDPYPRALGRSDATHSVLGKLQSSNETSARIQPALSDPTILQNYLAGRLTQTPPNLILRILGTHDEKRYNASSKKTETEKITDFDIQINLLRYLRHDHPRPRPARDADLVRRGSAFRRTRAPGFTADLEVGGDAGPTLEEWCQRWAADRSTLKVFRTTREVTGLDVEILKSQIGAAVLATHYRGDVAIALSTEEKRVDVYNAHWINALRFSWARWVFYLTFLWVLTWPLLALFTRRWDVYAVRWCWSEPRDGRDGEGERTFGTVSETEWVRRYRNLIQSLVMDQWQGDASELPTGVEDAVVQRRIRETAGDGGGAGRLPRTGNRNVDAAVGFLQGGAEAWRSLQGGERRVEGGGWGGSRG